MARLIFCFFAEDTAIFHSERLFTSTVEQMSARDSSDTHTVISELFRSMNTKLASREKAKIRTWANVFPYVNGCLFGTPGRADVPVGKANAKANGKAGNGASWAPHSQANENVGVPGRADVPVGKANAKANEKAGNGASMAPHSQANEDAGVPRANEDVGAPDVPRFSKIART
jgi:hypothetical protein